MKLWLLRSIEGNPHWHPWYDKVVGFVVRAESEVEARQIAAKHAGGEDYSESAWLAKDRPDHQHNPWLHPECSTCDELHVDGPPTMIIMDFNAA